MKDENYYKIAICFLIPLSIASFLIGIIFFPNFSSMIYQDYLKINATVPDGGFLIYDSMPHPTFLLIMLGVTSIIVSMRLIALIKEI